MKKEEKKSFYNNFPHVYDAHTHIFRKDFLLAQASKQTIRAMPHREFNASSSSLEPYPFFFQGVDNFSFFFSSHSLRSITF